MTHLDIVLYAVDFLNLVSNLCSILMLVNIIKVVIILTKKDSFKETIENI